MKRLAALAFTLLAPSWLLCRPMLAYDGLQGPCMMLRFPSDGLMRARAIPGYAPNVTVHGLLSRADATAGLPCRRSYP